MTKIRFIDIDNLYSAKQLLLYGEQANWQEPLFFDGYEVEVTDKMIEILNKNKVIYNIVKEQDIID